MVGQSPPDKAEEAKRVSITDAKAQISNLVRRVADGGEVILTPRGQPVARLVAMEARLDPMARRANIEAASRAASRKAVKGASAARSQDFLYGEDGLPE